MASKSRGRKSQVGRTCRASISLPDELHSELKLIAKQKKVSLAWVVRDAVEVYIKEKYPLFGRLS